MTELALAIAVMLATDPPSAATAFRHAAIAVASGPEPEILLAIAWQESRHVAAVVSRQECGGAVCRRVASRWRHRRPRPDWRPTYFCGVTQVTAKTWPACRRLIGDDRLAIATAQGELERWAAACRRRGPGPRMACALAGYGAGWSGWRRGTSAYARRVLRRRAELMSWARAVRLVVPGVMAVE